MKTKIAAALLTAGLTLGGAAGVAGAAPDTKPGIGNAVTACTGGLTFGQANSAVVRGLVTHPYFPGYQAGGANGLVDAVVAGGHGCAE